MLIDLTAQNPYKPHEAVLRERGTGCDVKPCCWVITGLGLIEQTTLRECPSLWEDAFPSNSVVVFRLDSFTLLVQIL